MKCDCIIQARLGSSRFPRKVLSLINEKPLLQWIIDRLKESNRINRIIVATTEQKIDDDLCVYCETQAIPYYRGSEKNVLSRFIDTGTYYQCKDIVRVCADNPFIDIEKLNQQIDAYFSQSADYCTYTTATGIPIILKPLGLFAEIVSLEALKKCATLAKEDKYFEHVTLFVYSHENLFKITSLPLSEAIDHDYRFTIDYPQDLIFCNTILQKIDAEINLDSIIHLMENNAVLKTENLNFSKMHIKSY